MHSSEVENQEQPKMNLSSQRIIILDGLALRELVVFATNHPAIAPQLASNVKYYVPRWSFEDYFTTDYSLRKQLSSLHLNLEILTMLPSNRLPNMNIESRPEYFEEHLLVKYAFFVKEKHPNENVQVDFAIPEAMSIYEDEMNIRAMVEKSA